MTPQYSYILIRDSIFFRGVDDNCITVVVGSGSKTEVSMQLTMNNEFNRLCSLQNYKVLRCNY